MYKQFFAVFVNRGRIAHLRLCEKNTAFVEESAVKKLAQVSVVGQSLADRYRG